MGIKRALISVSNKDGVIDLAKNLAEMGVEILSTGGTAKTLRGEGLSIIEVAHYTGFPEMMDGRVKTLHPKIHGGILQRRDNPKDLEECAKQNIGPIDMIVVNLYPFQKTITRENVSFAEAIENIDIGGPTMIRAAAKNFNDVIVVVDPADYPGVIKQLRIDGNLLPPARLYLAKKVFATMHEYDRAIAEYLEKHCL